MIYTITKEGKLLKRESTKEEDMLTEKYWSDDYCFSEMATSYMFDSKNILHHVLYFSTEQSSHGCKIKVAKRAKETDSRTRSMIIEVTKDGVNIDDKKVGKYFQATSKEIRIYRKLAEMFKKEILEYWAITRLENFSQDEEIRLRRIIEDGFVSEFKKLYK